jgi:hypothetical protein
MRLWLRLIMAVSVITTCLSIVLLLNITASNPTHRRYSSESPVMKDTSSNEIGLAGERVLSLDLGAPRNDLPTERQCFCNSPYHANPGVNECRSCIAQVQLTSQFRRPDFVTPDFIAESKNAQGLLYERRDFDQIGDYVLAARLMSRPLWVYVRVDTKVDAEYIEMVRSTGGDVVFYFTTPDYQDPTDSTARSLLFISIGIFGVGLLLTIGISKWSRMQPQPVPVRINPNTPRRAAAPEPNSLLRARRMTEATEDYMARTTDRAWSDIDRDTARGDLPTDDEPR